MEKNTSKIFTYVTRMIFLLLLLACPACDSCDDSGAIFDSQTKEGDAYTNACFKKLTGDWTFSGTQTGSGTLGFSSNHWVYNINQPSCAGMTVKNQKSYSKTGINIVEITYTVVCLGKEYSYTLKVSFDKNSCDKMTGTKIGEYATGVTEQVTLTRSSLAK